MGFYEHWSGLISENTEEARLWAQAQNVTLLKGEAATINGVRFIGCTLWTDYKLGQPNVDLQTETGEAIMALHAGGEHGRPRTGTRLVRNLAGSKFENIGFVEAFVVEV